MSLFTSTTSKVVLKNFREINETDLSEFNNFYFNLKTENVSTNVSFFYYYVLLKQ